MTWGNVLLNHSSNVMRTLLLKPGDVQEINRSVNHVLRTSWQNFREPSEKSRFFGASISGARVRREIPAPLQVCVCPPAGRRWPRGDASVTDTLRNVKHAWRHADTRIQTHKRDKRAATQRAAAAVRPTWRSQRPWRCYGGKRWHKFHSMRDGLTIDGQKLN